MSISKMFFGGPIFICIASALTDSSKRIEQLVDHLEAELCEFKDKCNELESTINALESKIDDLESLESRVYDLESKIDDLEGDLIIN